MKHYDVSLHFTPKGQNVQEIFNKIDNWLGSHPEVELFQDNDDSNAINV